MYWLVALMSVAIFGLIVTGLLLEIRPALATRVRPWHRPALGTQLLVFVAAQCALLFWASPMSWRNRWPTPPLR